MLGMWPTRPSETLGVGNSWTLDNHRALLFAMFLQFILDTLPQFTNTDPIWLMVPISVILIIFLFLPSGTSLILDRLQDWREWSLSSPLL
jgi:hypothetical protein